ncbi:MAG: hypothetical protein H6684_06225 [Deltaproteobacteria bacterium]|nr:hypothetical protein [Deltaproteobacteria bacterium]
MDHAVPFDTHFDTGGVGGKAKPGKGQEHEGQGECANRPERWARPHFLISSA